MIRHCSWRTAASIGLFSIMSTQDPFKVYSADRVLVYITASFVFLGQVIYTLPEKARARSFLWVFFLLSLTPYLSNNISVRVAQPATQLKYPERHPVQILVQNARTNFENMLQAQSRNFTAAHEEYRRRYKMDPPPGFEAWYAFAESHQSPIIDEFDLIHEAISPLLKLSGQEIRDAMELVQDIPGSELWACDFSGREGTTHCTHAQRTFDRNIGFMFNTLFRDLGGSLPDVKVLVNHIDEPRVLFPLEGSTQDNGRSALTIMSKRSVWDSLTKYCAFTKSDRTSTRQLVMAEKDFALPFVTDLVSATDLCRNPEYGNMHGLLMSPLSFRLLEGSIPVLSTGSLSTMGDILYPSAAYMEPEFLYEEAHDVDWDNKKNNLYWAGSTTGGFAQDNSWRHYHRQRFVELAQNIQKRQHSYLREEDGVLRRITTSFLNSRMFDVAFTRIFQCTTRRCNDERAYFKVKSWEDANRPFKSRLVFDMDGNGISGRFYKLLASRSTPLKQTILREWHDERLIPWLHYVPVSQGLEELPELVSHLTSTEAGQEAARFIAEQGRAWYAQAFREVDRTIYMYRLLLELARLQDPKRQPQHGSI
ncbi:hypothetical protein N0V82_006000 [Gnomoniopsis sp. IMI 355080]|nr:hypothetical protein N0V82_006000 [Gnomoniopsis sp. IMI 355080]